ncbi:permease-like cell division protein FtsX [Kaistella sp. PBT33-4]|uniref:cell division protein FtsX n=1 Tax=Kaistella sp. PBT33-4 TaxID=3032000 RepID=UPI0023D8027E|nr:permease-like cell division protein FtsX [Kaistella sp. PBT33-4]MDF0720805.1 permease-like cell division protein FtsX [Kaistella sp. PBT33-4]
MARTVEDFNRRRLRSSNITVVVSIALVLFLVGLSGLILINAQKYSDYLKEQLVVNAYFDQDYDAKDSLKLAKQELDAVEKIKSLAPVKKASYISREQASKEARVSLGIDSEKLFDAHIFPSSVEIALKPEYVDPAKVNDAIKQISTVPGIVDVKNNSESQQIYENLNKILKWILAFSVLFLILAIVLINNSIRLKIFSKRFIIKTMQLVGAKRRFILMPFVKEAIILGVLGAVLGILALFGVWYYFTSTIQTPFVQDTSQFILLVGLIALIGIFITVISTVFATWRFLRSNIDDLYYT